MFGRETTNIWHVQYNAFEHGTYIHNQDDGATVHVTDGDSSLYLSDESLDTIANVAHFADIAD